MSRRLCKSRDIFINYYQIINERSFYCSKIKWRKQSYIQK